MRRFFIALLVASVSFTAATARAPHGKIVIPDIPGYKVLKCDFHIHTLFSDGSVWPTVRVQEAADEGLDAISITDHIEFRPWSHIIKGDHNMAYDVAIGKGRPESVLLPGEDVLVIRGTEVSRDMPPGHWNAIFTQDNNPLETPDYRDAFREACRQGSFLYWNHPGWDGQAPNETLWHPEHEALYREGFMMGIEVYNHFGGFYPEAFQWALDRDLTIMAGTDTHHPMSQLYDFAAGEHRDITLVFARERSHEGILEALRARRTAVYFGNTVAGRENVLRPLFEAILKVDQVLWEGNRVTVILKNESTVPLILDKAPGSEHLCYKRAFAVRPGESFKLNVTPVGEFNIMDAESLDLNLYVRNFYVGAPDLPLKHTVVIKR